MKKILPGFIIIVLISAYFATTYSSGQKNVVNNLSLVRGVGWKNNKSNYSGSEMGFLFKNSGSVSFAFSTKSKADQKIEISIDNKSYQLQSPNLNDQKMTISVDKRMAHTASVRYYCESFYNPCDIELKGIYLDSIATILPYKPHTKLLSILGDSISTIYGKDNYSYFLAKDLGYELHDASTVGETVTNVKGYKNAISAFQNDILPFKSNAVMIFLGTNDISNNVQVDKFQKDYSKIVERIKEKAPNIFLVGILERKDLSNDLIQNYNLAINEIADKYNVTYIDTSSWLTPNDYVDDIHPTREAQQKIAENLNQVLEVLK